MATGIIIIVMMICNIPEIIIIGTATDLTTIFDSNFPTSLSGSDMFDQKRITLFLKIRKNIKPQNIKT